MNEDVKALPQGEAENARLIVREAKVLGDVEAIHEFMLANAIPEMAEATVDPLAYMESLWQVAQEGTMLMAVREGCLVGFLGISPARYTYSREYFMLERGFWVIPDERGKGAGELLLKEARAIADAAQMILKVVINNPTRRRGSRSAMAKTAELIEYRPAGAVLTFFPTRTN
jgi:GNAT superfamily N-acetyltransferase